MLKTNLKRAKDSPLKINDVLIIAQKTKKSAYNPTGEFKPFSRTEKNQKEEGEEVVNRLYKCIIELTTKAANKHYKKNFDGNILNAESQNSITRLITNEFFFYTKRPLTMEQFQNLQQKIIDFSCEQPENLHLLLATFAVQTAENKVMNVASYIECGAEPTIKLTVKNAPADIDPVYSVDSDQSSTQKFSMKKEVFTNVKKEDDDISSLAITVNNKECFFSYDNVIECKTKGDLTYYTGIDICLDHGNGLAKKNLESKVKNKQEPITCSHIVVSNCIALQNKNIIGSENITHVDPEYSNQNRISNKKVTHFSSQHFGTAANIVLNKAKVFEPFSPATLHQTVETDELLLNRLFNYLKSNNNNFFSSTHRRIKTPSDKDWEQARKIAWDYSNTNKYRVFAEYIIAQYVVKIRRVKDTFKPLIAGAANTAANGNGYPDSMLYLILKEKNNENNETLKIYQQMVEKFLRVKNPNYIEDQTKVYIYLITHPQTLQKFAPNDTHQHFINHIHACLTENSLTLETKSKLALNLVNNKIVFNELKKDQQLSELIQNWQLTHSNIQRKQNK